MTLGRSSMWLNQSPSMPDPPENLLALAVSGDTAALATLLQRFGPEIRAQLRIAGRWQSALDVDDVMQVAYLEAFLRIESFEPHGSASFARWLLRIAENNLRDAIRSLDRVKRPPPDRRVQLRTHDESAAVLIEQLGVTSTTPSRQVAAGELRDTLEAALDLLPEDYARAVRLYDLEGRPVEEAAAALGRSTGALHMLRARAHDRLRELLAPEGAFFSAGA
jgi:RNA polymerase sigma-70 factor (ECF subfamily)